MAAFSDVINFTRASVGYAVNKFGYIQPAGVNVPRLDFDPVSYALRGLLVEESRTNLIANSSTFESWEIGGTATISANSTISPDGLQNADSVTLPNSAAILRSSQYSVGAGVLHAFSVYALKNSGSFIMQFRNAAGTQSALATVNTVAGTITAGTVTSATINSVYKVAAGAGFDRYVMIASLTAAETGTARVGLSGIGSTSNTPVVWGAMVEMGPFETSYIPTTSAAVTRSADIVDLVNTNWLSLSRGTVFVEAFPAAANAAAAPYAWEIRNSAAGNTRVALFQQAAGQLSGNVMTAGVSVASFTVSPTAAIRKWAMTFDPTGFTFCVNGGAVSTAATGALPAALNAANIGRSVALSGRYWNGHIRRIRHFNRRLSNTELQALTA